MHEGQLMRENPVLHALNCSALWTAWLVSLSAGQVRDKYMPSICQCQPGNRGFIRLLFENMEFIALCHQAGQHKKVCIHFGQLGQYTDPRSPQRSLCEIMQVQTLHSATLQTSLMLHMRQPAVRCEIHQTRFFCNIWRQ
jgi:hypothetical protein